LKKIQNRRFRYYIARVSDNDIRANANDNGYHPIDEIIQDNIEVINADDTNDR